MAFGGRKGEAQVLGEALHKVQGHEAEGGPLSPYQRVEAPPFLYVVVPDQKLGLPLPHEGPKARPDRPDPARDVPQVGPYLLQEVGHLLLPGKGAGGGLGGEVRGAEEGHAPVGKEEEDAAVPGLGDEEARLRGGSPGRGGPRWRR